MLVTCELLNVALVRFIYLSLTWVHIILVQFTIHSCLYFLIQSYEKALRANSSYKPAAECLAIVLTDLGTSLKLAGNTQEGIQKYYEAIKIDLHYAVISCSFHFLLSETAYIYITSFRFVL